ncbi:MAG: response regulator [Flavisolibacter sp.]|jgi:CheY-like chemotaxis protein|nr:response regulator [Flavisolibacter sp.]
MKHKHSILIVDDDADDREIIRDAFETFMEEQQYVFLESGDRLLHYLEQSAATNVPSLIMLDLNMPGKDGREILKEIKTDNRFQHIPTIVFTTSSSQRDKEMVYGLGANCFITKPDTFNKLIEMASSISKLWLQ